MTYNYSYFLSEIWAGAWGTICMQKKNMLQIYEIIDDVGNIHMDTSNQRHK